MNIKPPIFSATKADFDIQTFPAGGPGGQHQNRSNTAVRITHRDSGLSVVCREFRSQHQNKKAAFNRLAKLLVAWATRKAEQQERPKDTIRTYHAVENRVKDHASGLMQPYSNVLNDPTDMITARHKACNEDLQ